MNEQNQKADPEQTNSEQTHSVSFSCPLPVSQPVVPSKGKAKVSALVQVTFEVEIPLDEVKDQDSIRRLIAEGKKSMETIHYHRIAAMQVEMQGPAAEIMNKKLEEIKVKSETEEKKEKNSGESLE